jgi:hypothetical protein
MVRQECRTAVSYVLVGGNSLIKSCRNDGMRKVTGRPALGGKVGGVDLSPS